MPETVAEPTIPEEYTWHLGDIFPTEEAWEDEFVALKAEWPRIRAFAGRVGESAGTLRHCLAAREALAERSLRLGVYAHLARDRDTTNPRYQAMYDRSMSLFVQANSETAFIEPEILALPDETIRRYLAEDPGLQPFAFVLEQLMRSRPHVLSAAEEQLLAMAGEVAQAPHEIFGMINDADMRFPDVRNDRGETVELTHGRFIRLMESPNRSVREEVFRAFYDTYEKQKNTIAATLAASVKKDIFFARARRYASALEAALFPDNVPVSVYDNLIQAVRESLPLLHRYMRLRKRVLGVSELHMYDIYVPLVADLDREVDYAEARDSVLAACRPLGAGYVRELEKGLKSRWVDVFETRGKRTGAYSSGLYGVHPFVLLNWQSNLESMFTLAHEMGHAMHSFFSNREQPFVNSHYSIFVAEVASTTNEALLLHHLLQQTSDRRGRLYLLNHLLDGFRTTVFRQTMFAEFERMIHETVERGGALTPETLSAMYRKLNEDYHGPDMVVDVEIEREWMRIPHFYLNFYVYKYATGFCAATALAERLVSEGGSEAQARYLKFLGMGGSDWPIEELKVAGIDMTGPQPIRAAMRVFERSLEEMEELL